MSENSEIHKATCGTAGYFRIPMVLLGIVFLVCLGTAYDPPAGRLNWLLEVGPGLAGIAALVALSRQFPMSHMAYWCAFLHMLILIYGGYYTYAETPLGNWVRDAFDLSRNPLRSRWTCRPGHISGIYHSRGALAPDAIAAGRLVILHHH